MSEIKETVDVDIKPDYPTKEDGSVNWEELVNLYDLDIFENQRLRNQKLEKEIEFLQLKIDNLRS